MVIGFVTKTTDLVVCEFKVKFMKIPLNLYKITGNDFRTPFSIQCVSKVLTN